MGNVLGQSRRESIASEELLRLHTILKKCPGCGRQVVQRGATYCDICKNIEGDVDGNVIVLTDCPMVAF